MKFMKICNCTKAQNDVSSTLLHLIIEHIDDHNLQTKAVEIFHENNDLPWQWLTHDLENDPQSVQLARLRFAKLAFNPTPEAQYSSCEDLLDGLLNLVESSASDQRPPLIEVILAVSKSASISIEKIEHFRSKTRTVIWDAIVQGVGSPRASDLLKIWIQWFKAPEPFRPEFNDLSEQEFILLRFLATGSQQTQKLCLYILRQFLALQQAQNPQANNSSERFCRNYETIIMGGYANQIDECLRSLSPSLLFSVPTEKEFCLDGRWWAALVVAVFKTSQADGPKRKFGNWLLNYRFPKITYQPHFSDVLMALIQWAGGNSLFLNSTIRDADVIHCEHGDRLAKFIASIFEACRGTDAVAMYLETICKATSSVGVYGLVYILLGFNQVEKTDPDFFIPNVSIEIIKHSISNLTINRTQRSVLGYFVSVLSTRTRIGSIESLQNGYPTVDPGNLTISKIDLSGMDDENENVVMDYFQQTRSKIDSFTPLMQEFSKRCFSSNFGGFRATLKAMVNKFVQDPHMASQTQLLDSAIATVCSGYKGPELPIMKLNEAMGHAHLWNMLNRLPTDDHNYISEMLTMLLQTLTKPATSAKGSIIHTLQAIILVLPKCTDHKFIIGVREQLSQVLAKQNSPRNRFLLEWAVISTYCQFPDILQSQTEELLQTLPKLHDETRSPKDVVSKLKVLLGICKLPEVGLSFIRAVIAQLPALCASTRVAVRFEALNVFLLVMDIVKQNNLTEIADIDAYKVLNNHVQYLLATKNVPISRTLELFDPVNDQTLSNLFDGNYLYLENGTPGLVAAEHFKAIDAESSNLNSKIFAPALKIGHSPTRIDVPINTKEPAYTQTFTKQETVAHQSKAFTLPLNELELLPIPRSSKTSIILVASLIDSPYNLGGLCRAAEIYGCTSLHIPDIKIIKDKAFTSVSVSSESHIPIVQTPKSDLFTFLQAQKAQGYTIVGVEQTDNSLVLGESGTSLPKKMVVVMGAEKTGIQPDVIIECDVFVEIRQWGVTRSLNVQTAAATVLYEWRRQWGDGI